MYRGAYQPRRPYPAYGAYQGPPRGAYGQGAAYQPRPVAVTQRHPYLGLLGIQNKFSFSQVDRCLLHILQRFPRRQVSPDLLSVKCLYADKTQDDLGIPLNVHVPFNVKSDKTCPVPEAAPTKSHEKDGVKTKYSVKVMIFGGPSPEDEKLKGKVHLSKRLNFLIVRKDNGLITPVGGEWSAELDGATPNDAAFKRTAIRVTKDLIGVDLSPCSQWLKFVEFTYSREEGRGVSVVLVPNVWDHFAEGIEAARQVKEVTKEVKEEVEEEEADPEDPEKKKKVKKQVTTTKTVEVVEWRPYEMSLHNILECDAAVRPGMIMAEDVVELCLFAECFNEMLQRDFGLQVLEILKQKKVENAEKEENDKKRKREEEEAAAEKKAKLENGEAPKEEEKKEQPAKPKTKLVHTVHQETLLPFQYFDKQHTGLMAGSLRRDVLEGVMHQYGTMTKNEIDDLLLKGAGLKPNTGSYNSPPSILYYVKIATTTEEVPVEEEKEEKKEETAPTPAVEATEEATMEEPAEAAEAGEEEAGEDGAMTEASLNKLLLKDLRTMCQEKGLNQNGKKAELIERLLKGSN